MDEKWQKVREIFDSALSRKSEERPKFVLEACGGDELLCAEVESLLASADEAKSFLEKPAAGEFAGAIVGDKQTKPINGNLGHYEIVEQIGAGGMGEVYLARDKKLDRRVAVKILNERFSRDEANLKRFTREAKAASALNHPNILVIHEIGESEDANYIVSEFVEGETLREILRGKNLPLAEVLDISIQIASALFAAHAAKIVHRDIKPENVVVRPDGLVKILDFGLAKLVEQKNKSILGLEDSTVEQNATAKGVILGTINYMSPEQAKGEQVDERTDVFSFGVLLYEMLTGRTPFAGASVSETFANLINQEPQPLARFSSNAPEELQRIVAKTLRKNKTERYQTTKDLLADLKDFKQESEFRAKLERSAAPDKKHSNSLDKNLEARTEILENELTGANAAEISTKEAIASTSAEYIFREIKNHKRGALAILAILLASTIGLGYWFYASQATSIRAGQIKSIAVLPLKPINTANRDELYEIGIADSLIQQLSASKGFVVRPLSAIRKYTDLEADPIAAGREQQVNYVLASNYQIADGKIRVTSQLFNVETGQTEETYKTEKDAGNIFAMQDAVAGEIRNILAARFAATLSIPKAARGTENEEAYRLYLQGMYLYDKRTTEDGRKAVEAFDQAVRLDPNYALAWAGSARAHRYVGSRIGNPEFAAEYQKSFAAINRALALDANLSEAHSALCENKMWYEYEFDGAERECLRAVESDPNSQMAHETYARYLMSRGRHDEAISEIKTAIALEPTSFFNQRNYGIALYYARRYDEAVAQFKRLIETQTTNAAVYQWLISVLILQGNEAEAFEWLMKLQTLQKADEKTIQVFQMAYQKSGWQGVLREQIKIDESEQNYFFAAYSCAQIGEKDRAFENLEKSFKQRDWQMAYLQVEPRLDTLRGDARFQNLIQRVSLPQ